MPSSSTRRFLSSDKFQVELKQLLGNDTPEYFKAALVLRTLAEEAQKEIGAKEKEIYELKEKTSNLTRDLSDANSEKLKLKGKLDVRGMIEEIELSLYPGKVVDPSVSRSKLWKQAKENPQHMALFIELANCFPSHGANANDAAISTIKSIYKKASDLIHSHVSSNQVAIVVRMQDFGGNDELCVIRALAKFYKFRLEEENLKFETVVTTPLI